MKLAAPALVLLISLLLPARPAAADDAMFDVAVGDPARKDRYAPLILDGITDTRTSEVISPQTLVQRLEGTSLLFVGEDHTTAAYHEVQLRILKELVRSGRKVLLGLEMYPYTEQRYLDDWSAGHLTEERFDEPPHWYANWGYNWNYYRDILLFARERKIPIIALNVPQEVVSAVATKGFDGLTEEEARHVPRKIDFDSAEHRKLFHSYFDENDPIHAKLPQAQWDAMFQAQCTWDAVMGHNAVEALKKHGGPKAIMVVLIGRGHVAYDLGAARQAAIGFDGKIASVIPVPVLSETHERTKVRASYAGFLWGISREEELAYPLLGITIRGEKEKPGLTVVGIQRNSVAEACGLCAGDELATFDGASVPDTETLFRYMSGKRWGDEVRLGVKRGAVEKTLACDFRRTPASVPLVAVSATGPMPAAVARPAAPRHALKVTLDPKARSLAVTDVVTLPPGMVARSVEFLLFAGLKVTRSEPRAEEIPLGDVGPFFGNNAAVDKPSETLPLKRYRVFLGAGPPTVTLSYEGRLDTGLSDPKAEYARGFRETAGTISPEGVYLAGSSFWVPTLDPGLSSGLASFTMEARGPAGWHLVSQGSGTSGPGDGVARWDSGGPMEEIYLVGGPLGVTRDRAGNVETAVYLRKPDETLAGKYLAAAAQYLAMYESLIGPYPYGKFALVENFWETGYGMPSFALLGPEVIRFPFILHSSYPHEILHNWWGNSVLVDYASGNWCEGLTAYLADHLVEEQRGKGDEYRRAALLRYRSYATEGRDFPLTRFRSRHSAATEAVGYGKALMTFHMVRRKIGDDAFRKALQGIDRDFLGKRATFQDLRAEFEYASGADLSRLFSDFVFRAGAPELSVSISSVAKAEGGGWEVAFDLNQTQAGEAFAVDVDVVLQTQKGPVSKTVSSTKARERFTIVSPARPVSLRVDPRFDVFRLLDARETPATLGQIFGDPKVLAVLSSKDEPALQDSYRKLLSGWQSDSQTIEVKLDTEVGDAGALPKDRAVWLVGRANRLAAAQFASRLKGEELVADGERMSLPGNSAVLVGRHPGNPEKAIGWLFTGDASALPGLSRKLPHYGKYATLGFEGSEPTNVLKSEGSAGDSPLVVDLRPEAERSARLPQLALEPRRALAELPPAFSQSRLSESVAWLAAPERKGRGLGSPGLEEATRWVADRFREAGLKPGGDGGTFVQGFRVEKGEDGRPHEVGNVIGILPGSKAEWKDESVLVTAHHDHLGLGFPDVHKGDEGKVHAGADDDASGVAVLIELARSFAASEKPKRSIVFVSFTGEEAGRLGSKRYASSPGAYPVDRVIGVVNLDTVGRLGTGKVLVLGTGTATEWPHVFRGASWVTGVESSLVPGQHEGSDQLTFIEKGIPGVQLFTGPHPDYHRPGDTADKIDTAGMAKVAALAREAVEFLAGREGGLTKTIAASGTGGPSPSAPPANPGGGRRVTFGTLPDFGFAGPGVRLDGTTPGSPAEKAGLRKGDVLVKVAGKPVENLRGFSEILRGLSPGQTVDVSYQRAGVGRTASVTVVER